MVSDYRINAQVRTVLVRRDIDLVRLEHGVTNGVIYLRGVLRCHSMRDSGDLTEAKLQEVGIASKLERTLRQLPGVRDVVFQLNRIQKVGSRWRPK